MSFMNIPTVGYAIGCIAILLLAACSDSGSGSDSRVVTPRKPDPVYIVKHMTADGTVMATYRARKAFADGGCVKFELIGDASSLAYRVACGNVSVHPEEQ